MIKMERKSILRIVFVVVILFLSNVSFCQINFEWYKQHNVSVFGTAYNPSFNNVAVDSSGNAYFTSLIIESNVVKILLNKYSASGNLKWTRTYQTNVDGVTGANGCIIKSDGKNSIYVASRYLDSTTNKILLLKYDSTGTMMWDRRYLNPGSSGDITGSMDIDKSGFIYITGNTNDGYDKCLVLKFKYNGDLVWNRNLSVLSAGNDIVVDQQGNSYIAGRIYSYNYGKDLMMTVKYDSSGVLQWTNSYGLNNQGYDEAISIILDDSSNVIVGGYSYYIDWNCTTLKYRNNGTLVKYTNYMQNGFSRVTSVATDSRCNVYITGQSSTGTILIKYDAMLAYKSAVMPTDYSFRMVKRSGSKYLYVAGSKNYSSPNRTGLYFAKLDTNLTTIYSVDYSVNSAINVIPSSFINDKNGNVYIGGRVEYIPTQPPYFNYSYPTIFKVSQVTGIQNISGTVVKNYRLEQNYPNPFNPVTKIKFAVPKSGDVKIIVYDVMGREIQTLVNEKLQPGTYETTFDGSMLNSGVYFYQLISGDFSETKRMILLK